MRRILINENLDNKVSKFYNSLFSNSSNTFILPKDGLNNLYNRLQPRKHKDHRLYIKEIIDRYEEIIKAKPSEMKGLIQEFNKLNKNDIINKPLKPKDKKTFYELIVSAMHYNELRSTEYHHIVEASGIKSCVYCNSQLAITVDFEYYDKKKRKRRDKSMAKFELDHYHSKSKHPFLCTSFYNLYPVCGNCNRAKFNNPINFELYTDDHSKVDIFKFWIDNKSIINYWLESTLDYNNLQVYFESINGDFEFLNSYNGMFAIQGIYDTQKDLAEELLHKAKVYTNSYKESLIEEFKELFPDKVILNRIIVGNYTDNDEINKRPMAKYTQDLAKQLGLI